MPRIHLDVGCADVIESMCPLGPVRASRQYQPLASNTTSQRFSFQDLVPITRLDTGRITLEPAKWRYWRDGRDVPTLNAGGRHFGRPCLIPANKIVLDHQTLVSPQEYSPSDNGWFMLAGVWQPTNQYSEFPYGFCLLTRREAAEGNSANPSPIAIPPSYWLDYLDPRKDVRWLYDSSACSTLISDSKFETV